MLKRAKLELVTGLEPAYSEFAIRPLTNSGHTNIKFLG